MAMTANGYIATKNDNAPWSDVAWQNYYEFIKQKGNIVVGRRTYEIMKEENEFEKLGSPVTVVVSSSATQKGSGRTTFVSSPKEALAIMEKEGMKEIIIGGGSKLNAAFLKEGLINELYIDVEPWIFGNGIKLFADSNVQAKLKLIGMQKTSENTLSLRYKIL